ncbi:N(4)-(Beta-N-acetylglucosaminyl)-L-asparaginase-like [Amphiura filiformis]|uniref:N(4)-(Beta-N-acetylglucosaminyl)-L-asparaginase- like n=1 Tax=Amphiura filiformis TaxID=82378 RepID=UPI003B21303C
MNSSMSSFLLFLLFSIHVIAVVFSAKVLPLVINTWAFTNATQKAWEVISSGDGSVLDAVEQGCSVCEVEQCDFSVGYGGSPDETGETTLDAMIMDGVTHDVGSVGGLRRIKSAISVARAVMMYTKHTLLVGEAATNFAIEMGFHNESLSTNSSIEKYNIWKAKDCQPNFRQNVLPDPEEHCGPYHPSNRKEKQAGKQQQRVNMDIDEHNHDTIGMTIVKGLRVGDSPITGSGAYVDNDVGGAAATGDGDVMMRFLPSYQVVENLRQGMSPTKACEDALARIVKKYPAFGGALVAANNKGLYGGACHGFSSFHYSLQMPSLKSVKVVEVNCTQPSR